jgi:hypothetical protein
MKKFWWHYGEMVVAMLVGMVVLAPLTDLVFRGALFERADMSALVMATDMSIGMAVWMRVRKHSWPGIGQMVAAMYVPFVVLFVPFWAGVLSGGTMYLAGHVLMLPCMLAVMWLRRSEYTHAAE